MRSFSIDPTPLKPRIVTYIVVALLTGCGVLIWLRNDQPDVSIYITLGWLIIISALLWSGNRFLTVRLDSILPWSKYGNYRFFIHLFVGLCYLLVLVNLTYVVLKVMLTSTHPTFEQIIVTNVYGAFIFIPLFSIYFSLQFLNHWRKSELAVERIQKEKMRSQLESLKSHLDPHFLFNNLNILSALIDKDPARSKLFMDKFTEVYRFLLRTRSEDLIPVSDELQFIQSYIYLLQTRFENNIVFTINVDSAVASKVIPPLTIQMLIENAIKHNVVHEKQPLTINLHQGEENYLIVSNNLSPGATEEASVGSGLKNIKDRYAHFTNKEVKVIKSDTHFEVHIPLLQIESL